MHNVLSVNSEVAHTNASNRLMHICDTTGTASTKTEEDGTAACTFNSWEAYMLLILLYIMLMSCDRGRVMYLSRLPCSS